MSGVLLFVDTSDNKKTLVELRKNGKVFRVSKIHPIPRSQTLLSLIDRLMQKQNLSFRELDEINVNLGPGSFTGLRVGVSVANTLGWALGVPVNGKDVRKAPVEPNYS